jgi:hypothetical protein
MTAWSAVMTEGKSLESNTLEGRHDITSVGRVRDTVDYSIIDDESPAVRARLEDRLGMVPRTTD